MLEEIKWAWEGLPPSPDDENDSADGCPAWYPPGYVEGVRLSDELTGPFQRYMERFVRYFPKNCYHVKRCYDGAWPQAKVKKGPRAGRPAALYDDGENKILTEMIERHLDYHQWMAWKDWDKVSARPHKLPQLWLALNAPKYLNHENIDIDSKRVLGYYRQGASEHSPLRPVMYLPLEHFQKIKAIYDAFPDRIWCISSESLGLHAWKWYHRLEPLQQRRLPVLHRLETIGYPGTEVHPMPGRPQRRPFGKDYCTITADGVLTNWVDQLRYFENPGPMPSFETIANVLLNAMIRQWRSWLTYRDAKSDKVYPAHVLGQHLHEVRDVRAWLSAGCPDVLSTAPLTTGTKTSPPASRSGKKEARPARSTIDMDTICKTGKWVQTCETWARGGLPHEDSIYQVAAELAKWLYWVEMYHLPPEKRQDHVYKLLVQYVERKHNGMCDRLIEGRVKSVVLQLGRIVQKVVDHGDVKPWQDMRRKRTDGEYHHVIELARLMVAVNLDKSDDKRERHGSVYSVGGLEAYSDEALPAQVVAMIEKKAGRNKVLSFATKFLNHLYQHGGRYGVSRLALMEMLGYTDPVRVTKYRDILVKAGVISKGGYRAHVRATEYTLLVKEAFETARGGQRARCS